MITSVEKLLFAIMQTENVLKLTKENESSKFIESQLTPVYYELKRQLNKLTASKKCPTIKE